MTFQLPLASHPPQLATYSVSSIMQQTQALSPQARRLSEDTDPRFSLLYRTPRTLEKWRKEDEEEDERLGIYKVPNGAHMSSLSALSRIACPLCCGHTATQEGKCVGCWIEMRDPRLWYGAAPTPSVGTPTIQTGSLLPAFGEVTTDLGARRELESRGSSPLDLPLTNIPKAVDDDAPSLRGDTVAPTTDGEGEGERDWETDAGTEEILYNVDPSLVFAASVLLPDDRGGEYRDDNISEDSSHQSSSIDSGEEEEQEVQEEREDATAGPNEGEPVTYDEEDGTDTPAGFSSFRHPDAPTHDWIAADAALQMIERGIGANGRVIPAASTAAMMAIFPPSQRMIQLPNERWRCRAMARINLETRDWEDFVCAGLTYKNKNDLRRHFTQKHLGDERAEKRCAKRKLDDEEDSQPDLPATKRTRRR